MKKIILGALLVVFGVAAQAVEVDLVKKVEARLISAFGPMLQVRTVEPLAEKQLLEVVLIDGSVVHMTPDINFFIYNDSLYHLTSSGAENVTENRLNPKRAAALKSVKDEDTVYFAAKGKQKAVIDVFTDIDCPYCQKLHQEVPRLNELGVSVRYFAYPRSGIVNPQNGQETESYSKVNYVWCSKDSAKAMTQIKSDQHDITMLAQRLRQRSEEHTSELQSRPHLVCRLLLEKKKKQHKRRLRECSSGQLPTAQPWWRGQVLTLQAHRHRHPTHPSPPWHQPPPRGASAREGAH